jgi:hypothetical protein
MKIDHPGIYRDFPTASYFDDPCPAPSLTQSIAKIIIEQSPLHAYYAHPRLHPIEDEAGEKYAKDQAIGNAAHALLLGKGKILAIGEFDDWRKKEAQTFRDEAVKAGHEPILRKHINIADEMVDIATAQLKRIYGCQRAFEAGDAEVVIANCENGVWLRSMLDWITPDLREVWDYKTTGKSVSPYNTGRLMADAGWHIQAAMHERILDCLDPGNAGLRKYYYVAQENAPPYALTVNEVTESVLTIGRKQIDYAVKTWALCMKNHSWPCYPPRIIQPLLPGYFSNAWLDREIAEDSENDPSLIMAG